MGYDFNAQLQVGQIAERYVYDLLAQNDTIKDVRQDSSFQTQGIDFISSDGTIEVKSDQYNTQMVFVETHSNKELNNAGWLYTCKADIIYWKKPKQLLKILWPETQKIIQGSINSFRTVQAKTVFGSKSYTSEGVLVPFSQLTLQGEIQTCQ